MNPGDARSSLIGALDFVTLRRTNSKHTTPYPRVHQRHAFECSGLMSRKEVQSASFQHGRNKEQVVEALHSTNQYGERDETKRNRLG